MISSLFLAPGLWVSGPAAVSPTSTASLSAVALSFASSTEDVVSSRSSLIYCATGDNLT